MCGPFQGVDHSARPDARRGTKRPHNENKEQGNTHGAKRRVSQNEKYNKRNKSHEKYQPPGSGRTFLNISIACRRTNALGVKMDNQQKSRVIEDRRNQSRFDNLQIRNSRLDDLEHHIRPCPHNRRNERTARTRRGFNPTSHSWTKTRRAHQRNGKRTRSRRIRHGTARQRPHHTRRNNSHFGWSPGATTKNAASRIQNISRSAGLFKHRAKKYKKKNVGEHHLQRDAKNALRVEIGLRDNALPVISAVGKEPIGQDISISGINQKNECEQRQGEANGATGSFEHQDKPDEAGNVIECVFESRAIAQRLTIEPGKLKEGFGLGQDIPKTENNCQNKKEIEKLEGFIGMDRIFQENKTQAQQGKNR